MSRNFFLKSDWPLFPVLLGALLIAAYLAWVYGKERRLLDRPIGFLLTGIRVLLAFLLILLLLKPVIAWEERRPERAAFAILLDASASMSFRDGPASDKEKLRLADALGILPAGVREPYADRALAGLDRAEGQAAVLLERLRADAGEAELPAEAEALSRRWRGVIEGLDRIRSAVVEIKGESEPRRFSGAGDAVEAAYAEVRASLDVFDSQVAASVAASSGARSGVGVEGAFRDACRSVVRSLDGARDALGKTREKTAALRERLDEKALAEKKAEASAAFETLGKLGRKRQGELVARRIGDKLARRGFEVRYFEYGEALSELASPWPETPVVSAETPDRPPPTDGKGPSPSDPPPPTGQIPKSADPDPPSPPPAPKSEIRNPKSLAPYTDLGSGVRAVEGALSGRPVAGILLLSDGGHNRGDDPEQAARFLGARGIPLHAAGIGDPKPPRDAAVLRIETNPTVFLNDRVFGEATVRFRGLDGEEVAFSVTEGDKVLHEERLRVSGDDETRRVPFSFKAEEKGLHSYEVDVPVLPGEKEGQNNSRSFAVRVVDERIKILMIEEYPRRDFRFLRDALERDPKMDLNAVVLAARDGNVLPRGKEKGTWPETQDALNAYDVIFFGDVPRAALGDDGLKAVRDFVGQRGGSVVFLAGELHLPWEYGGTPIEDLLPVAVPKTAPSQEETKREVVEGYRPALTAEGEDSQITRLVSPAEKNAKLWRLFPAMYWYAAAGPAKKGATVLAAHKGRGGEVPILAHQYFGSGKVFYAGTDETFRWRHKVGDRFFYGFWGQVIKWQIAEAFTGADRFVKLSVDRAEYAQGDRVGIDARILDQGFLPLEGGSVQAVIAQGDSEVARVDLIPVPGSQGKFHGETADLKAGDFKAWVEGASLPEGRSKAEVEFRVEARLVDEFLEVPMNRELLRGAAAAAGGRYRDLWEAGNLPESIPDWKGEITLKGERDLWDNFLTLALFAGLAALEWGIRKWKGLL